MKLHMAIGAHTWDFDGDTTSFNAPTTRIALHAWFAAQLGTDSAAAEDLRRLATTINAGASAVDSAGKSLDAIGTEGA